MNQEDQIPQLDNELLKTLYDMLKTSSEDAMRVLEGQLTHANPKIAQNAAKIILSVVLPKTSINKTWKMESEKQIDNDLFKEFMRFKVQKDLAEESQKTSAIKKKPVLVVNNEDRANKIKDGQGKGAQVQEPKGA